MYAKVITPERRVELEAKAERMNEVIRGANLTVEDLAAIEHKVARGRRRQAQIETLTWPTPPGSL